MFDFQEPALLTDHLAPIRFEDGSQREIYARIFEDGSFVCSTDESCRWSERMSAKLERWAAKGKTKKIARFFDQGWGTFDAITGIK